MQFHEKMIYLISRVFLPGLFLNFLACCCGICNFTCFFLFCFLMKMSFFFLLFLGHSQPIAHGMSATDLHQMETLKAENERLRFQLSDYTKKISRVASLEQEMAKIHQAYQSLLKHSEKRELLEKSARAKLQSVIINLSDANKVRFLFSNNIINSPKGL